jgi:hypothetical protein
MDNGMMLSILCMGSALIISTAIVLTKRIDSDNMVNLCVIITGMFLVPFILVVPLAVVDSSLKTGALTILSGTIGYFAKGFVPLNK